ncbi:MAG: endonuclease III [Theionarchaea archaeon]|nr:endonuclease III [Theionarchaea archaeon]MBU7039008.1 endonuclease III [Theionarchaea archaeon]
MRASSSDEILTRLKAHYHFTRRRKDPFKVLIATILSQRTRDENTARASEQLFGKFDTPEKLASARIEEIEKLIRPSGFYHVKAQRIQNAAQQILMEYGGEVPRDIMKLLKLEGVGRKTANCVLVYGFQVPAIPVDVHVHRISNRLGLVTTKTPEETESALMEVFEEREWIAVNELLVTFGKEVCRPRNPRCEECFLLDLCPTGVG